MTNLFAACRTSDLNHFPHISKNLPKLGRVLFGALLFAAAGCHSPVRPGAEVEMPRKTNQMGMVGYRTSVGDALDLFVLEDSSFNGLYIVRPSGDIIIPKAGRLNVVNMSLEQVEGTVKKVLETNQLAKATVIVDPVRRGAGDGVTVSAGLTVYLSGNVAKSGRVLVPFVGDGRVTAFQAIMDSGGFTRYANKKKSYLLRKDQAGRTLRVQLDFVLIEKGVIADVPLQDGDMLVVPEKVIGW